MANKTSKFEELIEKYRYWIGGILTLAIVSGSAVLIWRENYSKPKLEDRMAKLEEKIEELEAKNNQDTRNNNQLISNNQNSSVQTEQAQSTAGSNLTIRQSNNPTAEKVIGKININTATAAELDTLPGIGPAYAGRIIDYRNANGGFKSIDELDNVKGIGKTTIDKFRDKVTI